MSLSIGAKVNWFRKDGVAKWKKIKAEVVRMSKSGKSVHVSYLVDGVTKVKRVPLESVEEIKS